MNDTPYPVTDLSDADIADRIHRGRRCLLCREGPRPGGTLCWAHHDELGRILDPNYRGERDLDRAASIPVLYRRLDAAPGTSGGQDRRAPGFASTPPANLHIVAMRDRRSHAHPVVDVWHEASDPDHRRPHYEDEHAPRPVALALSGLADVVWDDLGYHGPREATDDVARLSGWLHAHLEHLTGRDDADETMRDLLDLHDQLRPAAGDPKPRPIGACTGWVPVPETGEKVECREPLYLPPPQPGVTVDPRKPVLRCQRCDRPYSHLMLLRLEIGTEREQRTG